MLRENRFTFLCSIKLRLAAGIDPRRLAGGMALWFLYMLNYFNFAELKKKFTFMLCDC